MNGGHTNHKSRNGEVVLCAVLETHFDVHATRLKEVKIRKGVFHAHGQSEAPQEGDDREELSFETQESFPYVVHLILIYLYFVVSNGSLLHF